MTSNVIWPLIDANISDHWPKLYLFDSLNKTRCGGDMSPYSVSGAKPKPPHGTPHSKKCGGTRTSRKLRLWKLARFLRSRSVIWPNISKLQKHV